GRHGGSGERQQRGPHPVEAEADRRQDPAGHRRSPLANREGNLRRLPRLRRANRRGSSERNSLDARLHQLQRGANGWPNLLTLLEEFYREKLAMILRHQAAARSVGQYDANNTYQYIIAREETQLSWVATAIADAGGQLSDGPVDLPAISGTGAAAARVVF